MLNYFGHAGLDKQAFHKFLFFFFSPNTAEIKDSSLY